MITSAVNHFHSFLLAQPHHPYSDAAGTASGITIPAGIASATPIAVPAGTGTNHHLILLA